MADAKRYPTHSFTLTANQPDRAEILAQIGVTPPEYALFNAVHYGITVAPSSMPHAAYCEDPNPSGPTEEECRDALTGCLSKGWLQVIDEPALGRIKDELRKGRFLGPIYGLPPVGGVDFTAAGAELWHRLIQRQWSGSPPFAYTDVVHSKTARFFRSKALAVAAMEEAGNQEDGVSVTGPLATGPWRAHWWRRFPQGYRIDIEERRQWQGRCGGSGGCFMPPVPSDKVDVPRLRHILDCHNVTLTQWLLLARMDAGGWKSAANLFVWTAKSAERTFGLTISEEELRSSLEECFRYGWLRSVDQQAGDEIQALLRDDPTLQPVPNAVMPLGGIDFTLGGATLYRMLSAEWLGPDWEDALWTEKCYYWEEHRYCEALEGFQGIVEEHEGMGAVVRSSKVVPIGPWCVYWWDRFSAGYRLELEIGKP